MTQCRRCLFTTDIKSVVLDEEGVCNFCKLQDGLERAYPLSEDALAGLFTKIKKKTKGDKYNCIMGISGGCDSSYMLWKTVEAGLNPLVVHWDNSWNTPIAEHNIAAVVEDLGVDLVRYKDNEVYHELNGAFLAASVSEADVPNDIAILTLLLETADKYGIKYNLSGHNFRTEGTCPPCWTMMDSKYVQDVYQWYFKKPLKDFPLMSLSRQVYWGLKGIKTVRPLYHMNYDKNRAKAELKKEFGWQDYGGIHCENIYTAFVGSYLLPKKFGIDKRLIYMSAQIRSGLISVEEAKAKIAEKVEFPEEYLYMVKVLYFDGDEAWFHNTMTEPPKTFMDYGDYYAKFRRYKWLYWLGMKSGAFPKTYYQKMTKEAKNWRK